MAGMKKKICVSSHKALGSRRICLELDPKPEESDLDCLKQEFLRYTIGNSSIEAFGGSKQTDVSQLVVMRYDTDFDCDILVGRTEEIKHLQKDIIVVIETATSLTGNTKSICILSTNITICKQNHGKHRFRFLVRSARRYQRGCTINR